MIAKLLDILAAPSSELPAWMQRYNRWAIGYDTWLLVASFAIALFGGQLVLAGMTEGYCIVWPGIGTRFAPGYSALGYARVRPGMTKAEVMRLVGPGFSQGIDRTPAPWDRVEWRAGDEMWSYSGDSSARGGDWAWLSREVVFRDGVVARKVRWTFHD